MARSLRVAKQHVIKVKSAVPRNGYCSQQQFAEELGIARATVSSFLNGRPVDNTNFMEICRALALFWQDIAELDDGVVNEEEREVAYVERPLLESRCYDLLMHAGALVRIKAPRQMGKTSLVNHVLKQAERQGYRTVYLSLDLAEQTNFTNLDNLLKWFCLTVGNGLGLPHRLADCWDDRFCTSKVNATTYFEEYLLADPQPLILCLDKLDHVFRYSQIASDFLGLIRAWHEQAKARDIWKRLRLVITHSEEPVALNPHQSPFNVGVLIELPELDPQQVETLAKQYGLSLNSTQIQQLMELVGGHPYLVQHALSHFQADPTLLLEKLLHSAPTESGIYCSHLLNLWLAIQSDALLARALKQVITTSQPARLDLRQAHKLYQMGLVKRDRNDMVLRCNLYRLYFRDRLGVTE